ncbi:toxin-activating lysine-acyltransferase [Sphingomonas sanguinis]|uniref:toxin-activating lysine-acyltransferase n=1 Tax=Sphingomonas sanguinis TaxID=33051 RepID=UPI003A0FDA62
MALGKAADLLFKTSRRSFSLASAHLWLTPPIRLEQMAIRQDVRGSWSAYITWAFLTDEMSNEILNDPPFLHVSDWNEGENLWIIDAVALPGCMYRLAREVSRTVLRNHSSASYLIRDTSGKVIGHKSLQLGKLRCA